MKPIKVLLVILFLLAFPVSAHAATTFGVVDGVISTYNGNSPVVEIPEGVTKIAESAFNGHSEITEVILPSTLEEIGPWAFWGCVQLKSITIPASVKRISRGAFEYCYELREVLFEGDARDIEIGLSFRETPYQKAYEAKYFSGYEMYQYQDPFGYGMLDTFTGSFVNSGAIVKKNGKFGVSDYYGEEILPCSYDYLVRDNAGFLAEADNVWTALDADFNVIETVDNNTREEWDILCLIFPEVDATLPLFNGTSNYKFNASLTDAQVQQLQSSVSLVPAAMEEITAGRMNTGDEVDFVISKTAVTNLTADTAEAPGTNYKLNPENIKIALDAALTANPNKEYDIVIAIAPFRDVLPASGAYAYQIPYQYGDGKEVWFACGGVKPESVSDWNEYLWVHEFLHFFEAIGLAMDPEVVPLHDYFTNDYGIGHAIEWYTDYSRNRLPNGAHGIPREAFELR